MDSINNVAICRLCAAPLLCAQWLSGMSIWLLMIHLGSNPNWSGNFFCGFKLSFFLSITDWFKWYFCDSHSGAHWNSQLIVAGCEWKDFPPPLTCKTLLGVNLDIILVRIAYIYHCCSYKVFCALRLEAVCNYAGTFSTTYFYGEHMAYAYFAFFLCTEILMHRKSIRVGR